MNATYAASLFVLNWNWLDVHDKITLHIWIILEGILFAQKRPFSHPSAGLLFGWIPLRSSPAMWTSWYIFILFIMTDLCSGSVWCNILKRIIQQFCRALWNSVFTETKVKAAEAPICWLLVLSAVGRISYLSLDPRWLPPRWPLLYRPHASSCVLLGLQVWSQA